MRVASQCGEAIAGDAFHDKEAVDVLRIKVTLGNCRLGGGADLKRAIYGLARRPLLMLLSILVTMALVIGSNASRLNTRLTLGTP